MAGRYTGSYLDRRNGWRPVAILAGTGQASLVERIPQRSINAQSLRDATKGRRL